MVLSKGIIYLNHPNALCIPREMNNICDIALLLGFDALAESITADQIDKAVYAIQNL